MKKHLLAASLTGALIFTASAPLQGCYGSFALTQKLYKWNGKQGDKWINSIIMLALSVVPIYEAVLLADGLAFNTVEFWSGNNPVTMGPTERDSKLVSVNGKNFMVTATRNRIDLVPIEKGIQPVAVVFEPEQKAWFVVSQGTRRKIAEQDGDVLALIYPDGHREQLTQ
jgi:hypothetical protein